MDIISKLEMISRIWRIMWVIPTHHPTYLREQTILGFGSMEPVPHREVAVCV
jgi:hypothetical protein